MNSMIKSEPIWQKPDFFKRSKKRKKTITYLNYPDDFMLTPTYNFLREEPGTHFQGLHMNPNPALFKYTWRLFTLESPMEGRAFLQQCPEISTAEAMTTIDRLNLEKKSVIIYNRRLPRMHSPMVFDQKSEKWADCHWACSLEDDTDSEWEGHK